MICDKYDYTIVHKCLTYTYIYNIHSKIIQFTVELSTIFDNTIYDIK